jgi:simple sugar transport system substrate-binding protein
MKRSGPEDEQHSQPEDESPVNEMSRRKLLALGAGGATALLGTAGDLATSARAGTRRVATPTAGAPWVSWVKSFQKPPFKIAVNSFLTANPFFNPLRVAVSDAAGQLGVTARFNGTPGSDTPTQISQFNALVRAGYQAIVVIQGDAAAWVTPINRAVAKGVLVLCANQDSPKSKRELFFGQDLYAGGVTQAQLINKFTGGKKGKVLLTNCAPGSDAMTKRNGGSHTTLTKLGYTVISELATDSTDPAKNRSLLENAYRAHPDIVAISAGCAPDTAAAGNLKQKVSGKFAIVGHDMLFETLQLIKQGVVDATLGQNPYAQGYLPIMYAYQRIVLDTPRLTLPGSNYFTGTEPVTKANVDKFIARETRFK